MKKTRLIQLILLLTIVGIFVLRNRVANPTNPTSSPPKTEQGSTSENVPDQKPATYFNTPSPPTPADFSSHVERVKAAFQAKNLPINFWGKVVDQDGVPLAGVSIKMHVRQWGGDALAPMAGRPIKFDTETDGNGRFEAVGKSGDVLTLDSIKKDGYRLSPKALKSINYGRASNLPSQDMPVILKMWKEGGEGTVVEFHKSTRIPYDGTTVTFDLLTGEKLAGAGDLRVTLLRTPLKVQFGGKVPYDWIASIEAVDGGVVEPEDEFMFLAPESGYKQKLEINMPASATNWVCATKRTFYLKSRGGQHYGRVTLEFDTDSPQPMTGFRIDSVLNPTGSRNLEP